MVQSKRGAGFMSRYQNLRLPDVNRDKRLGGIVALEELHV